MQVNLVVLLDILKDEYSVKIAKSGQRALDIAKQGGIDLILLDVVMPEMDGYEVCRVLQSDKELQSIPVIFVTGNSESEDEAKGFVLGAVDYITKPFQPTTVLSRVKNHLSLRFKQLELEELNEKSKRYLELIDKNVITSSTDLEGIITYVSEAFCKICGYSKEELVGAHHRIVRHKDMPDSAYKEIWSAITQGKTWKGEIKNSKKDGGFYWVEATISPIYDKTGTKIGYTAIRQEITNQKLIEKISITDSLTDIYNRRHFNQIFPTIINSAKRHNELICFLMMDIDHFKQYNDNYGHQAGDEVLAKFARCLKESLHRAEDLAFRLGGEEFGILYKAQTKENAYEFALRVKKSIEELGIIHNYSSVSQYITASMGLVCKDANEIEDVDEIYKQADNLLYKSKERGRNRVSMDGE